MLTLSDLAMLPVLSGPKSVADAIGVLKVGSVSSGDGVGVETGEVASSESLGSFLTPVEIVTWGNPTIVVETSELASGSIVFRYCSIPPRIVSKSPVAFSSRSNGDAPLCGVKGVPAARELRTRLQRPRRTMMVTTTREKVLWCTGNELGVCTSRSGRVLD